MSSLVFHFQAKKRKLSQDETEVGAHSSKEQAKRKYVEEQKGKCKQGGDKNCRKHYIMDFIDGGEVEDGIISTVL